MDPINDMNTFNETWDHFNDKLVNEDNNFRDEAVSLLFECMQNKSVDVEDAAAYIEFIDDITNAYDVSSEVEFVIPELKSIQHRVISSTRPTTSYS